mgnify:CR=1 FL=1
MGTVKTTTNSNGSTTTSKLRFSYDADGKVVAVNYNGNYYYYLRNAQSDIVKLIDKTGATVVEYAHLNSDLAADRRENFITVCQSTWKIRIRNSNKFVQTINRNCIEKADCRMRETKSLSAVRFWF